MINLGAVATRMTNPDVGIACPSFHLASTGGADGDAAERINSTRHYYLELADVVKTCLGRACAWALSGANAHCLAYLMFSTGCGRLFIISWADGPWNHTVRRSDGAVLDLRARSTWACYRVRSIGAPYGPFIGLADASHLAGKSVKNTLRFRNCGSEMPPCLLASPTRRSCSADGRCFQSCVQSRINCPGCAFGEQEPKPGMSGGSEIMLNSAAILSATL
ncbi:hypothetical protein BDW02DRAFT_392651 [Decorospora gaudefroyi]|uniref:Uncharacterized protein n=1 Tax=Decorospora gaudefroyi TaxID=184978 RepID=A0A6A5KDR0_9PLEO|nr:hypothetical protein BDW02DRAFT_392651 [Decorospora gaudefroyi]